MTKDQLVSLVFLQATGKLDEVGKAALDAWAEESHDRREWLDRMADEVYLDSQLNLWERIDSEKGYEKWLAGSGRQRRRTRIIRIAGWAVAACMVFLVLFNSLQVKKKQHVEAPVVTKSPVRAIPAGRNTATLTLGNGRQILLDSVMAGDLVREGNVRLVKGDNASLSYLAAATPSVLPATYNVLTTPKAGQYQLTLPDGTKVWLNNVSSLRYPTRFGGKEREVELTGEAYFEISKRQDQPFVVKVRDAEVEVLGTSFNIMAYEEEGGTQTTLLTGAVRVKSRKNSRQLKPDEQAVVSGDGSLRLMHPVSAEDIVSWKNGFFYFGQA